RNCLELQRRMTCTHVPETGARCRSHPVTPFPGCMTHAMSDGGGWHSFPPSMATSAQTARSHKRVESTLAPPDAPAQHPRAPRSKHGTPVTGHRAAGPRILLVAPQPFFSLRGTPMNVKQMAAVLGQAGYRVHLATFAPGEPVSIPGVRHHRALAIPGVSQVPIGFSGSKVIHDAALALLVTRLLLRYRFALAHAVEESVFFTLPLARARKVPVIFDLDSSISDQLSYGGNIRHPR